ncbi:MAG: polysaccharide biosynthesis tyrosine autokinase [Phycisphaerales bacterium]|jgi:capsular exopolysaccharide synthesis family protein|nr:polysaccharide biosynthesis tyrosine autokinase [Phycisphaerales bacterium]MBT7171272.1 polysaccharide biosynthesis tyrosine autokinase [Phycisphaerales bacterium]
MYLDYYNLEEHPFSLNCDERFYYKSAVHAETLENILYTVRQRQGLVLVTGEIGSGKTFMAAMLRKALEPTTVTIPIQNPPQSPRQLVRTMAQTMGLRVTSDSEVDELTDAKHQHARRMYKRDRLLVMTIDECQDLSEDTLLEIRRFANWEEQGDHLLQMVLIGQPELREQLQSPQWEPIRQRVVLSYHLGNLSRTDSGAYIDHRLSVASGEELPGVLFSEDAKDSIFEHAGGTPRVINVLSDNVLRLAASLQERTVTAERVEQAAREMVLADPAGPSPLHLKDEVELVELAPTAEGEPAPRAHRAIPTPPKTVRPLPHRMVRVDKAKADKTFSELLVSHHDRGGAIAEEYRALRTSLIAQAGGERFCYMVTSAEPGEGKTVTTINLGLVLAEWADKKTILVDFNMRNGRKMAKMLHGNIGPGMAEMLRGEATLNEVIQPTPYDNLFFISAGDVKPGEIGNLVSHGELEELVIDLRRIYDFVIFDTPAINQIADAGMLGLSAGEALLVVRMYKTRRESVETAIRLLEASNVKFGGVVLTDRKHFIPDWLYDMV